MSADRPLSARYDERVFPERPWSPTVAQALTVLRLHNGQELPDALIESFVAATDPLIKELTSALLENHNGMDPEMRKAAAPMTVQSATESVIHSPNEPFFQDELDARSSTFIAAIAVIGLQMIKETFRASV